MLQLEVTPSEEGYEVSDAFCTSELTFSMGAAERIDEILAALGHSA